MPAMQPIDRDVLTGLQLGDERALERVFRDRFAPLSQQATAALDDAAAAPRVVEGAFVRVWEERGHIESPEALESFLYDAVKSGAARERSRRAAAHRMGHAHDNGHAHEGTHQHAAAAAVTVDDAWAHVSHVLHAPAHGAGHSEEAQHAHHDITRHDAAAHVAALGKRAAWQIPTAIAVVLAVAIFGAIRWMDNASADTAVTSALASPDGRTVSTLASQRAATTLGDGSKVSLGADAKLRIPPSFPATMRAVKLDGAASFEVATDAAKPFIVRAGDASITATGTAFDVSAYPKDAASVLRVRSGSVTVKSLSTGTSQTVEAGQSVAVTRDGAMSAPSAAALDEAFGWTDGRFVVDNRPLGEVLPLLVRWYGMDIKPTDPSLLTRPVTMRAPLASSREAIAALESSAKVKFDYQDKAMVLRDAAK